MKSKRSTFWPLYAALSAIAGVWLGIFISENQAPTQNKFSLSENRLNKLQRIFALIENNYVERVNVDSLMDYAINDILHRLDPHSSFIDSAQSGDIEEEITGRYYGAGMEFTIVKDTAVVLTVFPGSPAASAAIKAGDKLLTIDGENLTIAPYVGNLQKIIELIRNPKRNKIRITLLRENSKFTKTLEKEWIAVPSVNEGFYLPGGIAVIGIERFAENTYQNFLREAKKLRIDTAKGVILDLRDNPGGLMIEAVRVAREFLSANDTVVIVEDRSKAREAVKAVSDGRFRKLPLVVLVNEGTASAAEVLAGAIQDNSRGLIAGSPTFGKGLVQEESLLPDGSRVRITTARYFTPSGRSIQSPYLPEIHKQNSGDRKIHTSKNGKTLLERGGIQPDINLKYKELHHFAHSMQYMINPSEIMFEYVSKNGESWKNMGFERFLKDFKPTFEEALQLMGMRKNASTEAASQEMKDFSILHVKATLAYMLYGPQAGKKVIKMNDPIVLTIAEQFNSQLTKERTRAD
ncbi:MAG: S41 family peptidase [Thermaurantimonas sp.]|uniref:S41 family peptidase n=1 Tax=Thermaurantimonas sp. TaxID=2681568 RepID=UPI003918D2F3